MPRYFFHIRDAHGVVPDEEGNDCAALSDALAEAEASARDLARQLVGDRKSLVGVHVDIADAQGVALATLSVMETIERPLHVRFRDVQTGVRGVALERAESEHRRRKLVIAHEREALDARDAREDQRWLLERATLSASR